MRKTWKQASVYALFLFILCISFGFATTAHEVEEVSDHVDDPILSWEQIEEESLKIDKVVVPGSENIQITRVNHENTTVPESIESFVVAARDPVLTAEDFSSLEKTQDAATHIEMIDGKSVKVISNSVNTDYLKSSGDDAIHLELQQALKFMEVSIRSMMSIILILLLLSATALILFRKKLRF